jgi:hypothetical protein
MAVTLTNLNDTLISQLALNAFTASMAPLARFSTSYAADAARRGQVVSVPLIASLTATTAENSYESADTGSASNANITIGNYYKATIGIKDSQWVNSSFLDIEKFALQQGKAVALGVVQALFTSLVCTTGFFTSVSVTSGAASFGIKDVRAGRKTIAKQGVDQTQAFMVLGNDSFDTLLGDSTNLLANLAYGSEPIKEGRVPRILGLDTMEVSSLPTTANTLGFIAHPSAIALAVRPLVPQDSSYYIESKVVTDDKTGLSLTYRRHYAPASGTHFSTFESLAGWTAGITQGAVRFNY